MAKYLLSWGNLTDGATLTGGSWLSTLPLNNLKNRQVQRVARSTNDATSSTQFIADTGGTKQIQVLALIVHNMSVSARIRITGDYSGTFASPTYVGDWQDVWSVGIIPQDQLEWEEDHFWLGTMTAEARAGYNSPWLHVLPTAQSLRYWKIEIDDVGNPDGYVHLGRLFMAPSFTPAVNPEYGAEIGYEDPTEVVTSLSGAEYFDVRGRFRTHRFTFGVMSSAEAHNKMLELQRLQGVSGEVLMVPDKDDADTFVQRSFVGRLQELSPISNDYFGNWSQAIKVKELI